MDVGCFECVMRCHFSRYTRPVRAFCFRGNVVTVSKLQEVSSRIEPHAKVVLKVAAFFYREMRNLSNSFQAVGVAYGRAQGYHLQFVPNKLASNAKPKGNFA